MNANEMYDFGYQAGQSDATDGDTFSADVVLDGEDYFRGYTDGYSQTVSEQAS